MTPKELRQILQAMVEHGVQELNLETPDYKLSVRRGGDGGTLSPVLQPSLAPTPSPSPPPPLPEPEAKAEEDCPRCVEIKAPIVGTFYRAPAPDAPPYVEVGSRVEKGQVLCIIEAMKLMNEIESEVSGIVRKILVQNGEPVEYGQPLFLIEPL